ncbi:CvpA family protein [Aneurinibacillus sp. Ricciae_BoGa-3]|uniref:CvpA family protein n=1 Tax=Aneurinibacillus sp. Ricciae_BoGa-3 TaxID=3022697 RepID=UPI00234153A7|nr:CvpA family protein [Aneurinibacillus sp. Ricciae_BoGa-3]WCK53745.1 CvpA family protein [Aneurinibacillus sp. Ricciae_BoGa-3]
MSLLDVVLLLLLIGGIWSGYRQGLVAQLVKLVALVLSFVVAFMYHKSLAAALMSWFPLSKISGNSSFSSLAGMLPVESAIYNSVAFFFLLIFTGFVVRWLGGFLNGIAKLPVLSLINRILGAVVGFLKNGLILALIIVIANVLPISALHQTLNRSAIASLITKNTPSISQIFTDMTKKPVSKATL